jgi:protein required for attachment to host cells
MALPNRALVLVADGRKMLFFRNHGDENQIDLRTEADAKDSEMKTDLAGAAAHGAGVAGRGIGAQGGGHVARPAMDETDYHQLEEDKWVKEAADELKKRALRNDYEALVVIAPPKALGVLRKELHKEVERRIVKTINKEMTDRPIPDIEELLVGEAAPPA